MILVAFPGQGSQCIGMARGLFNRFSMVRELFKEAEDILGWNLPALIFEASEEELKKTNRAQPALFVTCIALLRALEHISSMKLETFADFVLGHSLGQCTAICAAGAVDFQSGLAIVKARAECMARCCDGSMLACMNTPEDVLQKEVERAASFGVCSIANYNSSSQVVVSGQEKALEYLSNSLKELGYKAAQLNVSGAFHSSLMGPAAKELEAFLLGQTFMQAKAPLLDASTVEPISDFKASICGQLVSPIKWMQSVDYCLKYNDWQERIFLEIGPKNVLTSLARRDGKPFNFFNLSDAASLEVCASMVASHKKRL